MSHIAFTPPMESRPVTRLPEGPDWVYELKLDGYRAQAIREKDRVRLLSRTGRDLGKKYPAVVASLSETLHPGMAVDGELVALVDGKPSMKRLKMGDANAPVTFYAFDILINGGKDVKGLPLHERLSILDAAFVPHGCVELSRTFPGPAQPFIEAVRKLGGPGVIAKRLDSKYEPGTRSGSWLTMSINLGQEFVIGGFVPGRRGFDSLLVGFYRDVPRSRLPPSRRQYVAPPRELIYVAQVRAGFVPASRRALYARLQPLVIPVCPFVNLPEETAGGRGQGITAVKMKGCAWVKPELVGQFEFREWTETDQVRDMKFVRMRDDKDPRKVVRETR